ncbi:MAG TPA: SAM-dependent methyltransferase, partial [Micavibrio sp.]
FLAATLFTTAFDLQFEGKGERSALKKLPPSQSAPPSLDHDRSKKRLVETAGKDYLRELKITDASGAVLKSAQDKYRQIDKYIEILDSLVKDIPPARLKKIVDMGAGKGYLTFALYDHLHNTRGLEVEITGVEYRADLVELCNGIARRSGFDGLSFVRGSIDSFDAGGANVLIALHACDTATDDAIAKGIEAGAELIVVAPCCHKQIRREMEKAGKENDLEFLLRHGIFMERQAEMVTDGIRALILEYCGYAVKVFEFISDAHTPKNVLIVATRRTHAAKRDPVLLERIKEAKSCFGIGNHYLEGRVGI